MSALPEAVAISRSQRLALFDDDVLRPFANMIDRDGDEIDNSAEAILVVVQVLDKWVVLDLREFDPVATN